MAQKLNKGSKLNMIHIATNLFKYKLNQLNFDCLLIVVEGLNSMIVRSYSWIAIGWGMVTPHGTCGAFLVPGIEHGSPTCRAHIQLVELSVWPRAWSLLAVLGVNMKLKPCTNEAGNELESN